MSYFPTAQDHEVARTKMEALGKTLTQNDRNIVDRLVCNGSPKPTAGKVEVIFVNGYPSALFQMTDGTYKRFCYKNGRLVPC